jgi:hypothetical protein
MAKYPGLSSISGSIINLRQKEIAHGREEV